MDGLWTTATLDESMNWKAGTASSIFKGVIVCGGREFLSRPELEYPLCDSHYAL